MSLIRRLAVVVALGLLSAGCGGGAPGAGDPAVGEVVTVTDGDTVRVRIGGVEERVRLIGIDTPETRGPGGLRECFGKEATRFTERLLPPGTLVRLERDVEARDRYDRLLAYVYRVDDGRFVNLALAEEGYAAAATYPPNVAHEDRFVEAAARARERGIGLWAACGGPDTALETGDREASGG